MGSSSKAWAFFDVLIASACVMSYNKLVLILQFFVMPDRGEEMLKNNIEVDALKDQLRKQKSKRIGITSSYVNQLIRNNENIVNKTFQAMLETHDDDVKLTYEKREQD